MSILFEIRTLQPEQVREAKLVIYAVRHDMLHERETLEEAVAYYEQIWPLRDIDDFQQKYLHNGGTFLVTVDETRAIVGTGALWQLEENVCEIKRLWLLPEYQGQGHGYRMMMALLAFSREKGYTTVRLETSVSVQQNAIAFYKKLGFVEIPRFGDDPDDMAMEMKL